ncbi:acyltransferase [Planosporangium flavigriseum]|nr:acyltransferase [Planosporangium flavigriseum]
MERSTRLAPLDGLRLVAALTVVFYHYIGQGTRAWGQPTPHLFPTTHPVVSYGWTGVQLFFIISGFVICMSAWGRSLGDFVISRVVRLYPAYVACVVITTAVITALPLIDGPPTHTQFLINLTMLQEPLGVGHIDAVYWTLWAELRFYLLFSLVVWRGVTYRRVVTFCVLGTVAAAAARNTDNEALRMAIQPENLSFFLGGVTVYLMYRFGQNAALWSLLTACYLLGQLRLSDKLGDMTEVTGAHGSAWVVSVLLLAFYLLVMAIAFGRSSGADWGWLTTAGALTYPLYLLHEVIGWTLIKRFHRALPHEVLLIAVVAAMLALAWLVHRFVERPLAPRLKRQLKRGLAVLHREQPQPAPDRRIPRQRLAVEQQTDRFAYGVTNPPRDGRCSG